MTIYFAGGEMGAFIPSDTNVSESTSTIFDSSFARCAVRTMRTTEYAESASFSALADCWLHFEMSSASNGNDTTARAVLTAYTSSDTAFARLVSGGGGAAVMSLEYWNGTAWTNAGGTITLDVNTRAQTIDMHIVSNSASGSIKLYIAGTERLDSGTINLSSYSGVAYVRTTGHSVVGTTTAFSQIVVANESTIGWRLKTAPVTGAGATTDWTGSYTEIDELAYSDADFINSATANQVELFSHATTIPAGYTVRAVVVTARAKRGTTGPQNLRLILRSGGTTYDNGSDLALDEGYGAFCAVWETDPATSADFTASSIASLQFGVKSIA
jgi:hypothetical protein